MYRVLIVEDDAVIAETLCSHLAAWNMEARAVSDFTAVLTEFAAYSPQLVLLDISLPFYDGYHWCAEIRRISKVPIVFLSSASDNMNQIMAVHMGGDDFIAKPFDLNVLTAKLQAILRRAYDFSAGVDFLEYGGVLLNRGDATVTYEGTTFSLTKNEFRILQVLFENKDRIVSRERLMQSLWETDCFVDENTLTVNVARLRKKLAEHGVPELIMTQKGMGYRVGS